MPTHEQAVLEDIMETCYAVQELAALRLPTPTGAAKIGYRRFLLTHEQIVLFMRELAESLCAEHRTITLRGEGK